jgi:phage gpG-like protein
MTTKLRIESRDITRLRRRIGRMRERANDLIPAWEVTADWLADQQRIQFDTEGARWGQPWAPLAQSTLTGKLRRGEPPDILVRHSALERSLGIRTLSIERLAPRTMVLGTKVPYAHFHQRGTSRMPARILLDARPVAREGAISSAVASWIINGLPRIRRAR